jgi:predicted nucleotidyltransferase
MKQEELLQHITAKIVEKFNPKRIILFGSRARGEAREDSDYDLFIEMETEKHPVKRGVEISGLFRDRTWALDVLVYTPREAKVESGVLGTALSIIEKEGKLLYER